MEYLSIYDDNGCLTGKKIVRGDKSVLGDDEHFAVANIFIENSRGEFLIQKISKEKGGYYSTTGGHVIFGEDPFHTVVREVLEELGIDISKDEIRDYGYLLFDKPLRYLYYLKKNIDLNDFILQKEEVESVQYMSVDKIKKLIDNNEMLKSHGIMFNKLLEKIN